MIDVQIKTNRLHLRLWREEDLEPFAALNADEEVMEYFPSTLSKEESDDFARKIQKEFTEKGYGLWAVEIPGKAPFIGYIGLHYADFPSFFTPCVEIGWRLSKEYWGKGYATEGAEAVLEYAKNQLKMRYIYSFTAKINKRSIAVMERLKMEVVSEFENPKLSKESPLRTHVLYSKNNL